MGEAHYERIAGFEPLREAMTRIAAAIAGHARLAP
jgi:hypothetical protein